MSHLIERELGQVVGGTSYREITGASGWWNILQRDNWGKWVVEHLIER
jgi:hypothetical protein